MTPNEGRSSQASEIPLAYHSQGDAKELRRWRVALVQVSVATAAMAIMLTMAVFIIGVALYTREPIGGLFAAIAIAAFAYPTWRLYRLGLPVLLNRSTDFLDTPPIA